MLRLSHKHGTTERPLTTRQLRRSTGLTEETSTHPRASTRCKPVSNASTTHLAPPCVLLGPRVGHRCVCCKMHRRQHFSAFPLMTTLRPFTCDDLFRFARPFACIIITHNTSNVYTQEPRSIDRDGELITTRAHTCTYVSAVRPELLYAVPRSLARVLYCG